MGEMEGETNSGRKGKERERGKGSERPKRKEKIEFSRGSAGKFQLFFVGGRHEFGGRSGEKRR